MYIVNTYERYHLPWIYYSPTTNHWSHKMTSGVYTELTGYHNRRSTRCKGYDYSQPGYYFVTICLHDKTQNMFGYITNTIMVENDFAGIVRRCWENLPKYYTNITLDEFVVMPNHVHGIIIIRDTIVFPSMHQTKCLNTTNGRDNPAPTVQNQKHAPALGNIVAYLKYDSTRYINILRDSKKPVWQRSFHDHIIRDEKSLWMIREYIDNNPAQWAIDKNNVNRSF
jgi:REP element-mobilizing transposase RayT